MFQYYEALGLEPKLVLDVDDLRQRFYQRSRESHPDLAGSNAAASSKAEDRMALLNDAFRTLRNPVSRAEYFLSQRGIELSKEVPPELLEEVFELNMALEEIRGETNRRCRSLNPPVNASRRCKRRSTRSWSPSAGVLTPPKTARRWMKSAAR